jgi:hypothetical protein
MMVAALLGAGGLAVGVGAIPLDSVLARGDSSVAIVWSPSANNVESSWWQSCGGGCGEELRTCDFLAGETYRGVAYSYGGEDPHFVFRHRLAEGWPVGSHLCHYTGCGDPSAAVTGTDCSGYVCWVWDEPRVSTRELATFERYDHIAKADLRAGDILVKYGSHAVVVVDALDNPSVLVWEAAGTPVNGVRERVIELTATYWDGYRAVRNPRVTTSDSSSASAPARRLFTEKTVPSGAYYTLRGRRVSAGNVKNAERPGVRRGGRDAPAGVVFQRFTKGKRSSRVEKLFVAP